MTNLVSIDLGFSSVKALDANGSNPVKFPHTIAPRAQQTSGLDEGASSDMYITLPDSREWAVGHTALAESDGPVARRDADWIVTQEYEALLCAALSELLYGDAIVTLATGLPIEHWDRREALRKRLIGEHRFKRNGGDLRTITVEPTSIIVPQGLGAMINHALDEYGYVSKERIPGTDVHWSKGTVGIIDGGGNTVNYAAYRELREIGNWTAGADLGLFGPIHAITRRIAKDCPMLSPHPIEVAGWLERGTFTYMRKTLDIAPYADPILKEHASMIWNQAMNVWRSVGRMDAVLLSGGQALALGRFMPDMMNGTGDLLVVSSDPVFDNARGFLKLLRYRLRARER